MFTSNTEARWKFLNRYSMRRVGGKYQEENEEVSNYSRKFNALQQNNGEEDNSEDDNIEEDNSEEEVD